jgi:hypothetical protein
MSHSAGSGISYHSQRWQVHVVLVFLQAPLPDNASPGLMDSQEKYAWQGGNVPKFRENFYFNKIYAIILFKIRFAENFPSLSPTLYLRWPWLRHNLG